MLGVVGLAAPSMAHVPVATTSQFLGGNHKKMRLLPRMKKTPPTGTRNKSTVFISQRGSHGQHLINLSGATAGFFRDLVDLEGPYMGGINENPKIHLEVDRMGLPLRPPFQCCRKFALARNLWTRPAG